MQFAASDEGDEHSKEEQRENENAIQSASTKIANALMERLRVKESYNGFF